MNPDTLEQTGSESVLDTLDSIGFAEAIESLQPIGSPILGIVIPLIVFAIATGLTWWLYRHFSKEH
jgi:ribose/xylose/arabinose/galactoside ABC-type transport system permease subunit